MKWINLPRVGVKKSGTNEREQHTTNEVLDILTKCTWCSTLGTSFYLSNSIYVTTRTVQRNKWLWLCRKCDSFELEKKKKTQKYEYENQRLKKRQHEMNWRTKKRRKKVKSRWRIERAQRNELRFDYPTYFRWKKEEKDCNFYLTSRLLNYIIIIIIVMTIVVRRTSKSSAKQHVKYIKESKETEKNITLESNHNITPPASGKKDGIK